MQVKDKIKFVLVSLCTCKRPKMLANALDSVNKLNLPQNIKVEVLVVDNDPEKSAKETVETFKVKTQFVVHYFSESKRGICFARNRLLTEAKNLGATHVAMFDDDETLDSDWLLKHIELYQSNNDVLISSGPTYNKFLEKYPDYIEKNKIFKSSTTKKTGEIRTICASGNVFFPVSVVAKDNLYFDTSYVFMGGEDGDFFSKASKLGYTIVWNNEAVNFEMVGKERANIKWILSRQYYNGYSGALLKFKNKYNIFAKTAYSLKTLFVVVLDCLILLPSLLFGFTTFLNILGVMIKNWGKINGLLMARPVNYYENVCGE